MRYFVLAFHLVAFLFCLWVAVDTTGDYMRMKKDHPDWFE